MKYGVALIVGLVLIPPLLIIAAAFEMHQAWKNDDMHMWE
tara:strand:+ start:102 stop:221 length:120 start_codon:yes stop_codon:yes gene_type:complete